MSLTENDISAFFLDMEIKDKKRATASDKCFWSWLCRLFFARVETKKKRKEKEKNLVYFHLRSVKTKFGCLHPAKNGF